MTHDHPSPAGVALATAGVWSVDTATWRVLWSDQARLIHEAPAGFVPTVWEALDFIDGADRPRLFSAVLACVQAQQPFELEAGLTTARGTRKRVRLSGFASAAAGGVLPQVCGSILVVSAPLAPEPVDRNGLEAALREWELFGRAIPHELRGPLASIRGFADVLVGAGEPLSERGARQLARIAAAARHLDSLLEALLAFSPLATRPLRRDSVALDTLARECLEPLRDAEPGRQVDVRIESPLVAHGDADLLRLVVCNLMNNAWKFTRGVAAPCIAFGAQEHEAETVFCVSDNGVGFDMDDAQRLFAPFQRLHSREQFEGSGVGLAAVRRAVERHGGSVWAHSAPGQGACFFFALPRA